MLEAIHSGDVVFDKAGLCIVMGSDGNAYANDSKSDYMRVDDHELLSWKQMNVYGYHSNTDSFLRECFSAWYFSLDEKMRCEYVEEIIGLTLEAHIPF